MQTGEGRVAVVVVVLFVVVVVDVTVVVRAAGRAAGAGGGGRDSGDRSVGSTLALCQRLRWTQQRRPCNYCDLCITPSVFWLHVFLLCRTSYIELEGTSTTHRSPVWHSENAPCKEPHGALSSIGIRTLGGTVQHSQLGHHSSSLLALRRLRGV